MVRRPKANGKPRTKKEEKRVRSRKSKFVRGMEDRFVKPHMPGPSYKHQCVEGWLQRR